MFTNAGLILSRIQADLLNTIPSTLPNIKINLDEPINLVYNDLPEIAIYPVKEDFIYDSASQNQDLKRLLLRIEVRMTSGPASSVATPIINAICSTLRADRLLGGLAEYVELQSIQWANDQISSGQVCGASLDVQIDYYTN